MKAKEFFDLVSKMREAQKEYYKTRDKAVLNRSISLEKSVDSEIARVNEILKHPTQ